MTICTLRNTHNPGYPSTVVAGEQLHELMLSFLRKAHMDGFVVSIEIETVNGRIVEHPLGDISHVLTLDQEVACRSQSVTNELTRSISLIGGMLIEFWRNTFGRKHSPYQLG